MIYKYNDQIWEKEQSDHCRVMVEQKQHWNYRILNYRINLGNILRQHLIKIKITTIKILCCVGSSLIKKIKSSTKVPRRLGTRHMILYYQ